MGANVEVLGQRIVAFLRDGGGDMWPNDVIYSAILEAERAVRDARPDSTNRDLVHECVEGARQAIDGATPPAYSLLNVRYNVKANGDAGRALRRISEGALDSIRPEWRESPPEPIVREFMHDPREPTTFYVNPPAAAGVRLRLSYSAIPQAYGSVTSSTETTVSEIYEPALMEYSLYRLFGHDVEGSINVNRAQAHLSNFHAQMGIKAESQRYFGPRNPEHKA